MSDKLSFKGKVVLVTGAGGGLGRSHALYFAERGADICVNDLGGSTDGKGGGGGGPADKVVKECQALGVKAVADYNSVEFGDKIVKTCLDAFGKVDIVINNAGILRDVSFSKMTDKDWDIIFLVHVKGAYSVTKAAWETMRKQQFGRIIMTTSAAGLYGNFGQANYSAAKMAIVGLSFTLAKEGEKRNIKCNVVAPGAGSRMTMQILPEEMVTAWKPEFVAPMTVFLCHEDVPATGGIFEAGGGWFSQVQWARTPGIEINIDNGAFTPEAIQASWGKITDWSTPELGPSVATGKTMTQVFAKYQEMQKKEKAKL